MSRKKKVILITDGDAVAARTLEVVADRVGGSCVTASWGNPTRISGEQAVELIRKARREPVLVMVDDRGAAGKGKGESLLEYLVTHPEVEVLGTVAVASNSDTDNGIKVDLSIDQNCKEVDGPVDKEGVPEPPDHKYLEGDTVEILARLEVPVIVGTGDTGKMQGKDSMYLGAEITTRAVQEILSRSEK